MFDNHLISIQNAFKLIIILSPFILGACTSSSQSMSSNGRKFVDKCESPKGPAEIKYLTTAAQVSAAKKIGHCFQNYMRFEENKNQSIKVCSTLTVKKRGHISFVHLRGFQGDRLPKDIKMCMTQEYLKMNFKKMQLARKYTIRFPINFQSR